MDTSRFEPRPRIIKPEDLWSSVEVPLLTELLKTVDEAIVVEIQSEQSGAALNVFAFFNTPSGLVDRPFKPLNPREFLQYWISLTDEEKTFFAIFPEVLK